MTTTLKVFLTSMLIVLIKSQARCNAMAFDRYECIIQAKPFGEIASAQSETDTQVVETLITSEEVEEEANKLSLCAMTIMPDGEAAVGLIDNGVQPPANLLLKQGERSNDLEVLLVDYDNEIATFQRGEITFTLKYGAGLIETVTPESLAEERRLKEEAALAEEETAINKRPRYNSIAEQLIAMQMSLPPNVEAPPLPIPRGDIASLTKKFYEDEEGEDESEPQTEMEAIVKEGVEEMKASAQEGETAQSYLQRLTEHRQQEVERQKEEQEAARQTLQEQIIEDEESAEYIRRRTNIELIKKGVVPLNPVTLTTEEEQELIDAGAL